MKFLVTVVFLANGVQALAAQTNEGVLELTQVLLKNSAPVTINHCKNQKASPTTQVTLNSWLISTTSQNPGFTFASSNYAEANTSKCLYFATTDLTSTVGTPDEPSNDHPIQVHEALCFNVDERGNAITSSFMHQCY